MNASFVFPPELMKGLSTFITTLSGLAFETLPFLLIGTSISSAIHVFIPDRALRRFFPKNHVASIFVALGIGSILPICECATVPLARRLQEKGLPASTAVAFLLAAPIVNPMTTISTMVAFEGEVYPVLALRLTAGLLSALLVALIVEFASHRKAGISATTPGQRFFPVSTVPKAHSAPLCTMRSVTSCILELTRHTSDEFLDTSRYLIAGISVAAVVRSIIPGKVLTDSLKTPLASLSAGSLSAYLLSLCSSVDAFVAR